MGRCISIGPVAPGRSQLPNRGPLVVVANQPPYDQRTINWWKNVWKCWDIQRLITLTQKRDSFKGSKKNHRSFLTSILVKQVFDTKSHDPLDLDTGLFSAIEHWSLVIYLPFHLSRCWLYHLSGKHQQNPRNWTPLVSFGEYNSSQLSIYL